ncbi:hypothetical protein Tsubulata_050565 [Turnera subulata]|uniref:Uncharacterized protein n=1 Tax=Turnera subulata TaxID=218843 RepID=A0A9Q0F9A9_9ROSI|nr:hypothetical protein Tsubulata_050565 [Turnera subulata]
MVSDISKLVKRGPRVLGYGYVVDILISNPRILKRSLENYVIPVFNCVKDVVNSDEEVIAVLKRGVNTIFSRCSSSDIPVSIVLEIGTLWDPANPSSQSRAYQFKYSFHREEVEDFTAIQNINPKIVEFQRVRKAIATGQAATSN